MGKSENVSTSAKLQAPTSEQLRIAQLLNDPKGTTDPAVMREKVLKVIELTRCTESEALGALHDCDNDVEKAVDQLLEGDRQGEWIVKEGRKSRKSHYTIQENHERTGSPTLEDHRRQNEVIEIGQGRFSGNRRARGTARTFSQGPPPRFRGRGSGCKEINGKENVSPDGAVEGTSTEAVNDRSSARGRIYRGRGFSSRIRGRKGSRGSRRPGNVSSGFERIGTWNNYRKSETWDYKTSKGAVDVRDIDEWKDSSTWDNSMAANAINVNRAGSGSILNSKIDEWSPDDWGEGDDEWVRGPRVFTASNMESKALTMVGQDTCLSDLVHSLEASSKATGNGQFCSESIDVNLLFTQKSDDSTSHVSCVPVVSEGDWSKHAADTIKSELGIGKAFAEPLDTASRMLSHESFLRYHKGIVGKVELPLNVEVPSCIDIQFGEIRMPESDSRNILDFGSISSKSSLQQQKANAVKCSVRGNESVISAYTLSNSKDCLNSVDNEKLRSDSSRSASDILSSSYPGATSVLNIAGGSQEEAVHSQFVARSSSIAANCVMTKDNGVSPTRGIIQNMNASVEVTSAQMSKDSALRQQKLNNTSVPLNQSQDSSSPYSIPSSSSAKPINGLGVASKPSLFATQGTVNPATAAYQQAIAAGLSPYMGFYDQLNLNSLGFFPAHNLLFNSPYDFSSLSHMPPLAAATTMAGQRDLTSADMKQGSRIESSPASNFANMANLSIPSVQSPAPPGFAPSPSVSTAQQAAALMSLTNPYNTFPLMPHMQPPYHLAPIMVPSVTNTSVSAAGMNSGTYQKGGPTIYSQPLYSAGYDELHVQHDYPKSNFAMSNVKQNSNSSSNVGMTSNELVHKGYGNSFKNTYETKSYAPVSTLATFQPAYAPAPGYMPTMMASTLTALAPAAQNLQTDMNCPQRQPNQSNKCNALHANKVALTYGNWAN